MLRVILISLLAGAAIGVGCFYFGHAYATKYWNEFVAGLQKAKNFAEDELRRIKNEL